LFAVAGLGGCDAVDRSESGKSRHGATSGWNLVWHDEFDSGGINMTNWGHDVSGWGGGNNELQYYTDRLVNSFTEDGCLVLQAVREDYVGSEGYREFTSAKLWTRDKQSWLHGRIEIRARLPSGQGIWPAFWMMPVDTTYGGWAASGEIDIMESSGHQQNTVHGTLHYGGRWPHNVHSGSSLELSDSDFSGGFHNFALEWDTSAFRWYVDDSLYQVQTDWMTAGFEYPAPFDRPFYLILSLAVGGNWPGSPDSTTVFPQRLWIDYVRAYSAND